MFCFIHNSCKSLHFFLSHTLLPSPLPLPPNTFPYITLLNYIFYSFFIPFYISGRNNFNNILICVYAYHFNFTNINLFIF